MVNQRQLCFSIFIIVLISLQFTSTHAQAWSKADSRPVEKQPDAAVENVPHRRFKGNVGRDWSNVQWPQPLSYAKNYVARQQENNNTDSETPDESKDKTEDEGGLGNYEILSIILGALLALTCCILLSCSIGILLSACCSSGCSCKCIRRNVCGESEATDDVIYPSRRPRNFYRRR